MRMPWRPCGYDARQTLPVPAVPAAWRFASGCTSWALGGGAVGYAVVEASHAAVFAARAGAGLLITEGTSPSANGLGYARIPCVFSDAQVQGWRGVTQAVHAAGGKIFVQLMHTGRIGHALNLPKGGEVLAPKRSLRSARSRW